MSEALKRYPLSGRVVNRAPAMLARLLFAGLLSFAAPALAEDGGAASSVRHNIRTQTVSPEPKHDETLRPGGVGIRSVLATRRYMLDQIHPLPSLEVGAVPGSQEARSAGGGSITGQGR